MSLRARITIAMSALAAVSVLAVSLLSYRATEGRLRADLDTQLLTYGQRLADPDGRLAAFICGNRDIDAGRDEDDGAGLPDLPGAIIECTGTIVPGPPGDRATESRDRPFTVTLDDESRGGRSYRTMSVPVRGGAAVKILLSREEAEETITSLGRRLLALGAGVIALAAAAGWFLARRATRPITHLTSAAEHVAATGELGVGLPPVGRDEVGRLSGAFGSMLAALSRSRAAQERLVQDAGHELRTPLTSIRSNVDTLRRHKDLDGATREQILTEISGELGELSSMVEELVDLVIDPTDGDPPETLRIDELVARSAEQAERRRGAPVVVDAEPWSAHVRPEGMARAVKNLLDNAAKFGPSDAVIRVVTAPGRIEVHDQGPGFEPEDAEHAFDRFYRSDSARGRPGSGLGLAIVRHEVEAVGGSVGIGTSPQGGAVLSITLPVAPDAED